MALATLNGTLIWYVLYSCLFNYCWLILTVVNVDGCYVYFVNNMYFQIA